MIVSKIGEDMEWWAFSYLISGVNFGAVVWKHLKLPNKIKHMHILWPSHYTAHYLAFVL